MAKATVTITGLQAVKKKIDQIDWSKVIKEALYNVGQETIKTGNVQYRYHYFWKDIIEKDGKLDIEQIKKELYDFTTLMNNISKVYCHITGNQISKPLTDPDIVCILADDYYDRICQEYIKDSVPQDRSCENCKHWEPWKNRIEDPPIGDCLGLTGGEKEDGIAYLRVYDDSVPIGTRADFWCMLFKTKK